MLAVSIRISARSKPANIGTFDMGTALEYPDTDYKKPPERGGIVFEKTRMPPTECVRRLFRQPFRLSCMAASAAAAARPAAHIAQERPWRPVLIRLSETFIHIRETRHPMVWSGSALENPGPHRQSGPIACAMAGTPAKGLGRPRVPTVGTVR